MNHYKPHNATSIHAEVAACNNLRFSRYIQHIDIVVLRVNRAGMMCNSKPCAGCVNYMNTILRKRKYIISNIYYSNDQGTITKTKLRHLL